MNQENKLTVNGVIVKTYNGKVDVQISRPVACEGCGRCLSEKENIIKLDTRQSFQEGDNVAVEILCAVLTKISFYLYFIPAVSAMTGFLIGYLWKGNLGGFLGALFFLIISYLLIKKYTKEKYKHIIKINKI